MLKASLNPTKLKLSLLSQSGQEQLHSLTSETVRRLYDSQQDLLSTQLQLREATSGVFEHIAGNVKEILKEKSLIAAGNKELAAMTEGIRKKLGQLGMSGLAQNGTN